MIKRPLVRVRVEGSDTIGRNLYGIIPVASVRDSVQDTDVGAYSAYNHHLRIEGL
jgi:hypothetical protein